MFWRGRVDLRRVKRHELLGESPHLRSGAIHLKASSHPATQDFSCGRWPALNLPSREKGAGGCDEAARTIASRIARTIFLGPQLNGLSHAGPQHFDSYTGDVATVPREADGRRWHLCREKLGRSSQPRSVSITYEATVRYANEQSGRIYARRGISRVALDWVYFPS